MVTLINEVNMQFGVQTEEVCKRATTYTEYKDVESEFVREWEVMRKVQALAGLNFVRALAECVQGGSPKAPLQGIEGVDSEELTRFCGGCVTENIAKLLGKMNVAQGSRVAKEQHQWNSKFAQDNAVMKPAHFGKMADFNTGSEAKLGLPDPKLRDAMEREPCTRPDSKEGFFLSNYGMATTPEAEWRAVTDEEVGKDVSVGPRKVKRIADLRKHGRAEEAGLLDAEIIALYTGLMIRFAELK